MLDILSILEHSLADAQLGLPSVFAGRYTILRELGRGGMATVYLARDLERDTDVAVKVLSPDLSPMLGAERFAREIRIISNLQHPNILSLLDTGDTGGHPFYVMPYVDGESLAQCLRREGQLPIEQAMDIASQIASALAYAHARGFVHRDIKPSNILLSEGRALLADFGIARAIDALTNEKLTETGMALGTASYMSPEQSAAGHVDGRSDIYSLGCVLFEMLAGGPPFTGGSSQSVRARHLVDPVPNLHTVRTTVPPSLERIIVKAMAKVPADRFADPTQLMKALQGVDLTETAPAPAITSRVRRRPLVPALALVGILVAGALSWRMTRRGPVLDPNRVMVFPLVTTADFKGPRSIGEDVATMIGNAVDGAGPLRWIDAWPLLDPARRDAIRTLSLESARALAREKRCAFYVTGRLIARGDSAEVFLELNDVAGDSTMVRGKGLGSASAAWHLGLLAVNQLLPALIPAAPPDVVAEWAERDPGAVASYLLGEAAFRRVHLGDALAHYRDAVKADSFFGLAAIRGAQAATWNHRSTEAASFIQAALRQKLSPRYGHFALGYSAYLEGRADSAAAEFHRALEIDPEMAVAWMQLGEVYTHLLPEAGNVDSLAENALETAHRLDPRAINLLLHLIEIRLRKGDASGAGLLVPAFLAANPDTSRLADKVRIMNACVRNGPARVDWAVEARNNLLAVLHSGNALAAAGAQLSCAIPALAAVVRMDSSSAGDLRWYALLGLQGALLMLGRSAEAIAAIDGRPPADEVAGMYLLDGPLYPATAERATAAAAEYERRCGPAFSGCANSYVVWELALWEAYRGRSPLAEAAARELDARARRAGNAKDVRVSGVLARSAAAHAALARSDTATAFGLFQSLIREAVPGGEDIEWNVAMPRGLDRLMFARLLAARNDYRHAIAVADVFDSPSPSIYLLYLPASLRLRAEAADSAGERALASQYRARLAALGGTKSLATREGLPQ